MSRNFGAGSRDMGRAGYMLAQQAYRSFSSIATISARFNDFVNYIKERDIKRLEQVTRETVRDYAETLKERDLSAATAQNYLSAVNRIMETARGDQECRVTAREVEMERRVGVAHEYRGGADISQANDKAQAIYELARTIGLRFEEASKLDLERACREADRNHEIHITTGTKGGQDRFAPVDASAREALEKAREIAREQGTRNLIEKNQSYKDHQSKMYREEIKFHSGRHEYANNRYSELMAARGIETQSPVLSDKPADQAWSQYLAEKSGLTPEQAREIDREVRLQLSEELGHHREDVVSSYIGGQK